MKITPGADWESVAGTYVVDFEVFLGLGCWRAGAAASSPNTSAAINFKRVRMESRRIEQTSLLWSLVGRLVGVLCRAGRALLLLGLCVAPGTKLEELKVNT